MTGRPESSMVLAMDTEWEIVESGPAGAGQTVLLLPGGMCSARSYAEVMAQSTLAKTRLVAVTMPGHAGAPPPKDFSTESYARITAELAKSAGADVVARLRGHGAELVGEIAQYEDIYRLCFLRGPEGIIIGLAEQLRN